ncbi:MAG: DUF4321 domain-containing protein [Candidatus Zhuqueibacterota bacterium]
MRKKSLALLILTLLLGAILGSAMGELIALLLPTGVVKQFFLRSATIGFNPFTLNLGLLEFTLGFKFILNVIGIIGIAIAIYLLRWYYENRL